jgi:hypothetical protein
MEKLSIWLGLAEGRMTEAELAKWLRENAEGLPPLA